MEEKHIKQKTLADYTGISTSAISDWKKKGTNPSVDKIVSISECLGVSVDYLLRGTENTNRYNNNNNSFNNSNQTIGNGNSINANISNNNHNNIYNGIIEHLEALSKSDKFRAMADITDILEKNYPVKKTNI